MIFETKCKRCGKVVCLSTLPSLYKYKIGEDFFCGWNCYGAELTVREEEKRKREEAILEREREWHRQKTRRYYNERKARIEAGEEEKPKKRERPPILKIRTADGVVVARFATLKEAAGDAGISEGAMSRRINGYTGRRKQEFTWRLG